MENKNLYINPKKAKQKISITGAIKKGTWGRKSYEDLKLGTPREKVSHLNQQTKHSNIDQAIIEEYPGLTDTDLLNNKKIVNQVKKQRVKQLFRLWLDKSTGVELDTELELRKVIELLKQDAWTRALDKYIEGKKMDKGDMDSLKLFKDTLVDLQKLTKGERKIIAKIDLKDLRDMAQGEF